MTTHRSHRRPHQHGHSTAARQRDNAARKVQRARQNHEAIRSYAMAHGLLNDPPPIPTLAQLFNI